MNAIPEMPDPNMLALSKLPMPSLSDDAVVQIHDFLHHVLDLFEARYGVQLHRFYEGLCDHCHLEPDRIEDGDDSPF